VLVDRLPSYLREFRDLVHSAVAAVGAGGDVTISSIWAKPGVTKWLTRSRKQMAENRIGPEWISSTASSETAPSARGNAPRP
jgi:hypothetical protein